MVRTKCQSIYLGDVRDSKCPVLPPGSTAVLTDSLLDRTPHIQPRLVRLLAERADHNHTNNCKDHDDDSKREDAG